MEAERRYHCRRCGRTDVMEFTPEEYAELIEDRRLEVVARRRLRLLGVPDEAVSLSWGGGSRRWASELLAAGLVERPSDDDVEMDWADRDLMPRPSVREYRVRRGVLGRLEARLSSLFRNRRLSRPRGGV